MRDEETFLQRFIARSVVGRAGMAALATVTLLGAVADSHAGPCTRQILLVEQEVARLQANAAPSGAGLPTGPQSLGAQLHHQPTPQSVERAASEAKAVAAAALERARKADAAGDADACAKALDEVKDLYGID